MDRFSVVITGQGPHHSLGEGDVDVLLAKFVSQLQACGHVDVRCALTTNMAEEVVSPFSPPARLAELAVMVAAQSPESADASARRSLRVSREG